jgi:hypothetical protein
LKLAVYITNIFLICCLSLGYSQEKIGLDFDPNKEKPAVSQDSLIENTFVPGKKISVSKDSLDAEINYDAQDSMRMDLVNSQIHLYGDAYVKYTDLEVRAAYIVFDFNKNEAIANARIEEDGTAVGVPSFTMGDKTFSYKKLRYNFKTKKGLAYDAIVQEGQLYLHGAVTKFVSEEDSVYTEDQIFNKNALVTSCDLEHPHYGIRTNKLKVIPDKLAVLGPARLEIAGVPTPIILPFAFIPILKNKRSGLIFPRDYEFSENLGFGLREIGYYFALSEYMDLRLTGDIYTRGTWGVRASTKYRKRYKFNGNLTIGYSKQILPNSTSAEDDVRKTFSFNLTHNQDSKAHPYRRLQGSLRFTTNDYDRVNFNDAESVLENTINSNFGFTHSMPGTPFNFSASIRHSQNTLSRKIDFTLPDIQLRMNTIYPFKKKSGGGNEKWFEKINLGYNSRIANFITATDTTLFTKETLENARYGVSHDARVSASFNILEHFTFTPSIKYDEKWFFRSLQKDFDPNLVIDTTMVDTIEGEIIYTLDTLNYGTVNEEFVRGFKTFRNMSVNFGLNTNIFGTLRFSKGWLRGIRHTIKPSISFSYTPSTERYLEVLDTTDLRDEFNMPETYNPFSTEVVPFGVGSLTGKRASINYSITNIFEGKYFSKKDSTEKKFKFFDRISISGFYNFAADSLRWSQVSASGSARFFKGITNIRLSATWDPYIEINNRRVNTLVWNDSKKFLRFERFNFRISTRLTMKQIKGLFGKSSTSSSRESSSSRSSRSSSSGFGDPNAPTSSRKAVNTAEESLSSIFDDFSIEHVFDLSVASNDGEKDLTIGNHSIRMRGSVPVSQFWSLNVGNISYDIKRKSLVYPSIGISRDLHCWQLSFNWQPQRDSFSFFIGVKSSMLNFIKYNYGRNNVDGFFRPGG